MHELGIMFHIVKQVMNIVQENDLSEVEAIVLQVGEQASVIPKYLHNCFPAATDGTILENTKLEIEMLPANGMCRSCGKVFHLIEHKSCPYCCLKDYDVLSGTEFYLKEIRAG